ncbi:MAG: ester cyclase [Actinomycetota bacterium]|nr:ester cyclase [Actinomycetota bacterium]
MQRAPVRGTGASSLTGTGTPTGTFLDVPATGQAISTRELAMYRIDGGKIVECWGDLDSSVRDRLTWGPT